MTHILDPTQIVDGMIEDQIALVRDDKYPCCECGALTPLEDVMTLSAHPAAPGVCPDCFDNYLKEKGIEL